MPVFVVCAARENWSQVAPYQSRSRPRLADKHSLTLVLYTGSGFRFSLATTNDKGPKSCRFSGLPF
jgi:hypothetical protein